MKKKQKPKKEPSKKNALTRTNNIRRTKPVANDNSLRTANKGLRKNDTESKSKPVSKHKNNTKGKRENNKTTTVKLINGKGNKNKRKTPAEKKKAEIRKINSTKKKTQNKRDLLADEITELRKKYRQKLRTRVKSEGNRQANTVINEKLKTVAALNKEIKFADAALLEKGVKVKKSSRQDKAEFKRKKSGYYRLQLANQWEMGKVFDVLKKIGVNTLDGFDMETETDKVLEAISGYELYEMDSNKSFWLRWGGENFDATGSVDDGGLKKENDKVLNDVKQIKLNDKKRRKK